MQVEWLPPVELGSTEPRVVFGEGPKSSRQWMGQRRLEIDGVPAFKISFWCGTCQFLFERLEGSNKTVSLDDVQDTLNRGLATLDPIVLDRFGALLEEGRYLPMLLEVEPHLVRPGDEADYFSHEQVTTWGIERFWGLPEYPRTPYYRTFSTAVDADAHLYEFIVPLVPPSWNDPARVDAYGSKLEESALPTAVAVTTLDVCAPATEPGSDYYDHWGLTHFLLDGHHKIEAAARGGHRLQLLALVTLAGSLAEASQVLRLPELRGRPSGAR